MKIYKIISVLAVLTLLSACGKVSETTVRLSGEDITREETTAEPTTEKTTSQTISGEYTGETDIAVTLPGGDWGITMDNNNSTVFVQGDKTINASVIDDESFDTGKLPTTKAEIISRYTTAGESNIDVLDFSYEETESGTNLLRYTIKYKSDGKVKTLLTATEIINEHKAVVVDGIIDADADDAEISMMREAVDAAAKIKTEE